MSAMVHKTNAVLDRGFLEGLLLTGNEPAETAPYTPPAFLFGPGGQDYVGANSYDAGLQSEWKETLKR